MIEHKESASEGADAADEALALEVLHQIHEAHVFLAQEIGFGDADVLEEKLGGIGGFVADFLELFGDLEAGEVGRYKEKRATVCAAVGGGFCEEGDEIGADPVGDEGLLAAQ